MLTTTDPATSENSNSRAGEISALASEQTVHEEDLVAHPAWEETRRPSHADKRRALQREILSAENRAAVTERPPWHELELAA